MGAGIHDMSVQNFSRHPGGCCDRGVVDTNAYCTLPKENVQPERDSVNGYQAARSARVRSFRVDERGRPGQPVCSPVVGDQ